MPEATITPSPGSSDVAQKGPKATADYGTGARFNFDGIKEALTPEVIVKKFQTLFREWDDYRKQYTREWMTEYSIYNAISDDKGKEPWQANIFVPLSSEAVDLAAARITNSIFQSEDILEVWPDARKDDVITRFAKRSVLWAVRKSKAITPIREGIKDALICGNGWWKLHYEEKLQPGTSTEWKEDDPVEIAGEMIPPGGGSYKFIDIMRRIRSLRVECPLPTDVWRDPTGANRGVIQRIPRNLSDVWALARELKDPQTGEVIRPVIYDPKEVEKIQPSVQDSERHLEAATIRRDMADVIGGKPYSGVDLYEFYGDFPDPDTGLILFRNCLITFCDVRWMVRAPQRIPFRHCLSPLIWVTAKLSPHQVYGQGALTRNVKIQQAYNSQWNVVLDKAKLQVPSLEYDATSLAEPRQMTGQRPVWRTGSMWRRRPGLPPDRKIFYPVTGFPEVSIQDLQILDRLENLHRGDTNANEFATGQPTTTNRKTKAEVQDRTANTIQNFNDIAVHVEETSLSPLFQMIYYLLIQYQDKFDAADLLHAFDDDGEGQALLSRVQSASPEDRWRLLYLDAEFRAIAVTNELEKQKQLDSIHQFQQDIMSDPMLSVILDKSEQVRQFLRLRGLPKRMLLDNVEQYLQAMRQQAIQQMLTPPGQQPGQGGMPGAPGGTPGGPQPPNTHNQLAAITGEAGRAPQSMGNGQPQ